MLAKPQQRATRGKSLDGAKPRTLRYQRVYDLVLELIEEGDLRAGDQLPSTAGLAELAGVSIISVRRALDELAHGGKIVRHQGVGTFVAPQRLVSEPTRSGSLLGTISHAGQDAVMSTELLSVLVGLPSPNHTEALGIDPGQPVWEIARLRVLEGAPKILEKAVLPLSRVAAMDEKYLAEGGSLYGFLRDKYDLVDDFAEQSFEVDHPNSWEREHLSLSAQDSVVRVRGVSFGRDGIAFDCYQQTYPAHEFVFYVSGRDSPKLLKSAGDGRWSVKPLGAPSEA